MRPGLRTLAWVAACVVAAEAFVFALSGAAWVLAMIVEEG